ncbi:MAG: HAD family phosphatase [Acidobacteria bacterium]|nr:HAD family phosphatase [Acidobacteriota bacterium]
MGRIKGLIFDFDGVLVDSEPFWREADRRILESYGVTLNDDTKKAVIGVRPDDAVRMLLSLHGVEGDPAASEAQRANMMEAYYREKIPLFPGASRVLEQLQAAGYDLAVASSTPARLVTLALQRHDILQYFSHVVSAESVPNGKPAPDIFLRALELLSLPAPTTLVVEDSRVGLMAARAAGTAAVWVRNDHSTDAAAYADYTIEGVSEIPALIEQIEAACGE